MAVTPSCTTDADERFFLGALTVLDIIDQPDSENEWLVDLPVNGNPVEFKIDTRYYCDVDSKVQFKT